MTKAIKVRVLNIAYHRNGISGTPFHAVIFREIGGDGSAKLGIVFEYPGHVAVLDIAQLADSDVESGSNSWRGDEYEPALRKAVEQHQNAKK